MTLASGKGWIPPTRRQEIESMIPLDEESIRLLREVIARSGRTKGPSETPPDPHSKRMAHPKAVAWLRDRGANPRDYVVSVDPKRRCSMSRKVQILIVDDGKTWRVVTLKTEDEGMSVVSNAINKIYDRVSLRARSALAPLMGAP